MSSYGRLIRKLIDPRDFPFTSAAVEAGVFDQPDPDDYEFAFGLDRVLDGIDALVRTRG
jgi:hypothetical protein